MAGTRCRVVVGPVDAAHGVVEAPLQIALGAQPVEGGEDGHLLGRQLRRPVARRAMSFGRGTGRIGSGGRLFAA